METQFQNERSIYILVGSPSADFLLLLSIRVINGQGKTAQINWNTIQPLRYEVPCDLAQILDCCYAGNGIKSELQGRNELVAACAGDVSTPGRKQSYIQRLTVALRQMVEEATPFSLSAVYERIAADSAQRNINRPNPIPLPVHEVIPYKVDSITLRPRNLGVGPKEKAAYVEKPLQCGVDFLGWSFAKVPICRGDERREWRFCEDDDCWTAVCG